MGRESLPVIWDADFALGETTDSIEGTNVLCEINAYSTFAFPEHAMPAVALASLARVAAHQPAGIRSAAGTTGLPRSL